MKKYIIIDTKKNTALYGAGGKTMMFSAHEVAEETASMLFFNKEDYTIIMLFV